MKRFLVPVVAACLVQATTTAARNASDVSTAPLWSIAECPITCVVTKNYGGWIPQFREAAIAIKADGRRLVIDGECISACTVAADLARPNVCITKRAVLRFHKAYIFDTITGRFLRREDAYAEYSDDIATWVRKHGGFPGKTENDEALLDMPAKAAGSFFPYCKS